MTVGGGPDREAGAGPVPARPVEDFESAVAALYDEAKRTIAEWCREADDTARRIIANAENTRRAAHAEAQRVREAAQLEAGRILAEAESRAGEVRAGMHLSGAERAHDVEVLRAQVERLSRSVDQILDAMDGVLKAVAVFGPAHPGAAAARELTAGPPPAPPSR